jgi:hypothetical protein
MLNPIASTFGSTISSFNLNRLNFKLLRQRSLYLLELEPMRATRTENASFISDYL